MLPIGAALTATKAASMLPASGGLVKSIIGGLSGVSGLLSGGSGMFGGGSETSSASTSTTFYAGDMQVGGSKEYGYIIAAIVVLLIIVLARGK